ncbi:uncharacterized protein LOC110697558 isoform X2 [Chenopodium quinoa]|uniref:uncharacterized protein LOC110697558 isoform X2 n=1 Tax=Chenopodium quinoa TaxID=63459 RepID=UPI000B78BEB7|nr:uncharacterized protein LOC110697558 isoform X2 [Chenopodium quinoa]
MFSNLFRLFLSSFSLSSPTFSLIPSLILFFSTYSEPNSPSISSLYSSLLLIHTKNSILFCRLRKKTESVEHCAAVTDEDKNVLLFLYIFFS